MKIYLTDQKTKFKKHLDFFKTVQVMSYDKSHLKEKITSIDISTIKKMDDLNIDFLFNYQIFPCNILSFKTQWTDEKRRMQIGDTIVQQVYIPPTNIFSQKIILGVRINEIINLPNKKGFSYETLKGHVEKGISTFTIEEVDKKLVFKIHTFSLPGNFFSKLVGPVFSVPYQTFCTRAALKNVKKQIEVQSFPYFKY